MIPDRDNQNQDKSINFINKMAEDKSPDVTFGKKWTIRAIIICVFLLGIVYFFAEAEKNPKLMFVQNVIKKTGIRSKFMSLMGSKNILVLGVDSNGRHSDPFDGTRSDTILILNIDRTGKSVNAVSIPRDSKVYLAGGKGVDKINAAHALGGPELTIRTIEETFGIEINHYIAVNNAAVKDLVEALGGIPIDVEKRMYYRDRTAGLNINLQPGYQILDPEQAEGYLRFRHDYNGDIGRIKRQQKFVKAVVKKIATAETMMKLPQLYDVLSKNIRTDMNLFDLSKLFNVAKNVKFEEIKVATLPGRPSQHSYISYWILDTDKTQEIIDRLIYRIEPKYDGEDLTVSLYYAPALTDKIDDIVEEINEAGFSVKSSSKKRISQSEVIAHSSKAAFSKIKPLRKRISELKNSQYIVDPDENLYPCTDFTIILAE
ncbi:MAG: hypothetical protein A2Y25_03710 [Candidatus Melainabacteria bacterium GWF2_37_15]|nr:MAG: hypothetical protein A2Y25_03710 [Candidatus Melainabacteria bacterium GWF2_37_15]